MTGVVDTLRCFRLRPLAALAAAVLPAVLAGCTPPDPLPLPERPEIPFGQGRLWQVEGEGLAPSYVFATMHVADRRVLDLPEAVETAFGTAEIAAFELVEDPKAVEALYVADRLKLTGDEDLEDLIGSWSFGILSWHLKQRQLVPNIDVKPWVMWSYLGGEGGYYFDDLDWLPDREVLDDWLEGRAVEDGKEVIGLETAEEHFDVYDKMPLEDQANLLKATLERYSKRKPSAPQVTYYVEGDLAMLYALWQDYLSWLEPASAEVLNDRLIDARNRVMVDRALPLMERAPTFVAVGALHLPGEQGVLRLLERQGFTVTRLH